jgi:TonB-dependent receptor
MLSRASVVALAAAGMSMPAAARAERMVMFDIPAQTMPAALNAYARQARVQIFFPSALVVNERAPAIKGSMSPQAALRRLLAGSQLVIVRQDSQSVVLKAPGATDDTTGQAGAAMSGVGAGDYGSAPTDRAEGGNAGDILVVGTRTQAGNLKLRASNTVDVLSNEDLSHTAVHNVAEALGLMPSVKVVNTGSGFFGGVDGASRGDGQFVSIRGLNGEYNVSLINGAEAAVANPYSRSIQLSLIPPSGLNTIVLNKTSRADMNGDAIGGTIDFRTPSAFDFAEDVRGRVTVGGRLESRARAYDHDGLGFTGSGEVSTKFGADKQFGAYVSGYYDKRNFVNSMIGGIQASGCCDNGADFALQDADGNSAPGIDPEKNLIMTAANIGVSNGHTERYGGNATFDWHGDDGTILYLRGTYAKTTSEQNSNLSQVVGGNKLHGSEGTQVGPGVYAPVIGTVVTKYWYQTSPESAELGTVQFGGSHQFGRLDVSGNAFYSWGENSRPNHVEIAAGNYDGIPYGGSSLYSYKNGYPYPVLTPAMQEAIQNIATMPADGSIGVSRRMSTQDKYGGQLDFRYDLENGGALKYIKFGARFVGSKRRVQERGYNAEYGDDVKTLTDLGVVKGSYSPVFPGKDYNWTLPVIDQGALFDRYYQIAEAAGGETALISWCNSTLDNALNCNTQRARENVYAGYVMANIEVGGLELIPGFRFEHADIYNTFWFIPSDAGGNKLNGSFDHNKATFNKALPSLLANYRPDDRTVVRGAIWTSYTRPPFLQLGGGASETVSTSGGVTTITRSEGNPNLKAIDALNIDLSAERRFETGTTLSVAGFYKRLDNYIYDAGSDAGVINSSGTEGVITSRPENGGSGDVYGIEVAFQQRFTAMPSPFDGLGISGNFTRQWTKVDLRGDGTQKARIQNAPNYLANAQLFYASGPVTFDLTYTYSGSYITSYSQLDESYGWDNVWVRPVGRFDLHAGLEISRHAKLDLSISNLFNTETYWAHIGKNSLAVSDIVNSGTTSLLTASFTF